MSDKKNRWIIKGNSEISEYVCIKDSIEEIIVGEKFNFGYFESFKNYCNKYKIILRKISWFNGVPIISAEL